MFSLLSLGFIVFFLALFLMVWVNPKSQKIFRAACLGPLCLMTGAVVDMRKIHNELQEVRKTGTEITLYDYVAKNMREGYCDAAGKPIMEKLISDLGIDLKGMTVDSFFTTEENKWLFPEVLRDAIRKGFIRSPFYQKLLATTASVNGASVRMPHFDLAEANLRPVGEGADISMGKITWGDKNVNLVKRGRGFEQSYESLQFCPIAVANLYFEDLGMLLGRLMEALLIDVALNGDQSDGSEAPLVIGVATKDVITYADIAAAWVYMASIGRPSQAMVAAPQEGLKIILLDEFRKKAAGRIAETNLNQNTPLPVDQDIYFHPKVGTKKIIFIDPVRAFAQFTAWPLMIETDKVITKQWNQTVASIMVGFANIFADARIVLDYAHATTDSGYEIPWPTE